MLALGQREGLLEQGNDLLSNRDPLCRGDLVRIGPNGVGHDYDAGCIGIRRRGADVAAGGLDPAADPAEQVNFVSDIELDTDLDIVALFAG